LVGRLGWVRRFHSFLAEALALSLTSDLRFFDWLASNFWKFEALLLALLATKALPGGISGIGEGESKGDGEGGICVTIAPVAGCAPVGVCAMFPWFGTEGS
jgi:hypothetical protein